ncbi:MAG: pyridoxamine 5-phosphate oxidase [Ilumatobacteraceae bacterium]|nr:pyridoxamine 5-phosphate oxidase [Ilumatobacteraceae bacterium]
MTTIDEIIALARDEQYLAVVSTLRADSTIQSSLVNAGFMTHPLTREQVLAFVTYGRAKLTNLRARPQTAVTFRSGWRWATVEGRAQLIGPDDAVDGIDVEQLRVLLREVFVSAGGDHDDWNAYDRTMREQGRTVVFVTLSRMYSN